MTRIPRLVTRQYAKLDGNRLILPTKKSDDAKSVHEILLILTKYYEKKVRFAEVNIKIEKKQDT